jgi:hypothetical protein
MTRLAEWLNLYTGKTVSINELARNSGMAWATAKKYTDALAKLQHVLPGVEITEDGCKVRHASAAMHETLESPLARGTLALWFLSRGTDLKQGLPPLDLDLRESIQEMQDIQFIERAGKGFQFTKAGLSYANSVYGDILRYCEGDHEEEPGLHDVDWDDDGPLAGRVIHKGEEWARPKAERIMAA